MTRKRGFTLIELLVVMAIIALLIGLLLPALAKARAEAKMTKDGTQIKQTHTAWVTFSKEFDGIFPTPGLINRLPDPALGGIEHPGRGPEDQEMNNHANLHSACIMQNYYGPDLVFSPSEPNANVFPYDNYNWELYDVSSPTTPVYWDPGFRATLTDICNVSYFSMPLGGKRKQDEWRESFNSKFAILANRGPLFNDNLDVPAESLTYEIHGGRKQWTGNVCFQDNHIARSKTWLPEDIVYQDAGVSLADNLFFNNTAPAGSAEGYDIWLAMVDDVQVSGTTLTLNLSYDP